MKKALWACAALALALNHPAKADVVAVNFSATGISGSLLVTYGTATDAKYPTTGYVITAVSGTFSDSNHGLAIVDASVTGLEPVNDATPETGNLLAPKNFSRFAVASGLPTNNNGVLTYDNLFWPGGSPQTASDYPVQGGFLDIYGMMFTLANGDVVDLWSDGVISPHLSADYGVAVATSSVALDYSFNGVSASVPEPDSALLLGAGAALLAIVGITSRKARPNRLHV